MKSTSARNLAGNSFLALLASALIAKAATSPRVAPRDIVLVTPEEVTATSVSAWKKEGFDGIAIALGEETSRTTLSKAASTAANEGLALFLWIEVARNITLADAHPRWMASLGSHDDWQKRFPKARPPGKGEVAKAWPWVPIWYREAFEAHLHRIKGLLERAPDGYRGVILNDLQGGPSSCGCGNLQCRWATDYHVSATGTRIPGNDTPAKFIAEVRKLAAGKAVIPVWTTECEDEDLPTAQRDGKPSTGLCGTIGCAVGLCPKDFTKQWSALLDAERGPVGLLGLHREFERGTGLYGGAGWLTNAVSYLDNVPTANGGKALPRNRLWMVVQGKDSAEETSARRIATALGAATVIVARTRIDQSYEPRMIPASE